jgi:hypothetical protein
MRVSLCWILMSGCLASARVTAIRAKGGAKVTATHVDTDHGWSDKNIAIESTVLTWLAGLN